MTQNGPRHKTAVLTGLMLLALMLVGLAWFSSTSSSPNFAPILVPTDVAPNDLQQQLLRFVEASTLQAKLALVRHPSITSKRIERSHSDPALKVKEFMPGSKEAAIDGMELRWIDVRLEDDSYRTAVFELTENGPVLDWESFVLYEEIPWDAFRQSTEPGEGRYRVICELDDYYNYTYDSPERFISVRISHPSSSETCWAYAARSSKTGQSLLKLLAGRKIARSLLQLQRKPADHPSQLWIDRIVSDSWFFSETDA